MCSTAFSTPLLKPPISCLMGPFSGFGAYILPRRIGLALEVKSHVYKRTQRFFLILGYLALHFPSIFLQILFLCAVGLLSTVYLDFVICWSVDGCLDLFDLPALVTRASMNMTV